MSPVLLTYRFLQKCFKKLALEILKRADIGISDFEVVKNKIDRMIPKHNFEFIIATSEYMFRKPNKRIFQLALEKAELNPEDVWYVGDNYECDVVGARNAGIFPVWYVGAKEATYAEKEDILMVKKWGDLQDIIITL